MKAKYWPCRGVYSAEAVSAAGLRATLASLCGEAHGRVHESSGEGPPKGTRLGPVPVPNEAEDVMSESLRHRDQLPALPPHAYRHETFALVNDDHDGKLVGGRARHLGDDGALRFLGQAPVIREPSRDLGA